jgi:putative ABC transport system permease protein
MHLQLLLARRYLLGRRLRTVFSTLAVLLGVMIIFGMNGIVPAVRASFDETVRVAAHTVDLVISPSTNRTFPGSIADVVRTTPGVALAAAVLEQPLLLPAGLRIPLNTGDSVNRLVVNGWEAETSQAVVPFRPVEGRWLAPGEDDTAMVLASLTQRSGLAVGDTLTLPAAQGTATFTIVGVLPERAILGDEEVYISLAAAQALFGLPDQINAIAGQTTPEADPEAVGAAVLERLGPGFTLGTVEAGSQEWGSVLQMAELVFTLFGLLALAMGGFILFNTFRTSVVERRRDIGMLRAIGASRRTVISLVLTEGILIGAVGTLLGMLLGGAAVALMLPLISPGWERFFGAPLGAPGFSPFLIGFTVVLGIGVPVLSALLPARTAASVPPLEALRPSQATVDRGGHLRRAAWGGGLIAVALAAFFSGQSALVGLGALLFLIGLMLVSGALVFPIAGLLSRALEAGLPGEGLLAQRNLTRQPGRAAVTASAMLISLAIMVALGGLAGTFTRGLMGYLEQSMRADYLLLPEALVLGQSNVGAGPELAEALRSTPGIAEVTTLRRSSAEIAGAAIQVIGLDPATYPAVGGLSFTAGDPTTAFSALAQTDAIIVNGMVGAPNTPQVGDTLTLETPTGPRTYTVVGVGVDYLNSRVATAYVNHNAMAEHFGVVNDVLLMANRAPDANPAAVEAALLDLVREYPAFALLDYASWRVSQLEANQTRTNILYVLMAFLAAPALLALANTLGISALERTREIALLRAVGATQRQIGRMFLAESLLLAGLGAGLGILAGIGLGYAMVGALGAAGFSFTYAFPTLGVVVGAVVAIVFGVAAAMVPVRHAARLNIVGALRYE